MATPLKMQSLMDLSKAVVFVRKKAEQFRINQNKLVLCGFSAGGHLCGSLAVHYDAKELVFEGKYEGISNRPDAVILSYPVITSGEYAHRGSFIALFGEEATEEELEYMSLEKHVTKHTPPTFLWQTAMDELVPVENSYFFAKACKEHEVIFEHHVFGNELHGMSLANEEWASRNYDGIYTMQQFLRQYSFAWIII
jgi:acetyl esterase/lipase